ncbi:uncharacterized protein Dwil_GK28139 [Drosophila willistoni]|nr:uncharacterized protein Dwil_GK28139 [Drosophila willistoni]
MYRLNATTQQQQQSETGQSTTPTTTQIKLEPMPDVIALTTNNLTAATAAAGGGVGVGVGAETGVGVASTSKAAANGHLVVKRPRLDGPEDWMSTPSPGSVPSSAPPLSPSPGSQNHSYNMSNGYASPMSAGSYDPYSPNGKTG